MDKKPVPLDDVMERLKYQDSSLEYGDILDAMESAVILSKGSKYIIKTPEERCEMLLNQYELRLGESNVTDPISLAYKNLKVGLKKRDFPEDVTKTWEKSLENYKKQHKI